MAFPRDIISWCLAGCGDGGCTLWPAVLHCAKESGREHSLRLSCVCTRGCLMGVLKKGAGNAVWDCHVCVHVGV